MDQSTKESGKKIELKDKAHTLGQIPENTLVHGLIIICIFKIFYYICKGMDKGLILGQMVGNMKALMKMIKNMDLVFILGRMDENMKDIG